MKPSQRARSTTRATRGFTLLELVIALSVFAVLSVISYATLRSVIDTESATREASQRLADLQLAVTLMTRDFEQAAARGIRYGYGAKLPPLRTEPDSELLVEFSHFEGARIPGSDQINLRRVGYGIEEGKLVRSIWQVLDRTQNSDPIQIELLDGVREMSLRFLDRDQQWHTDWPPLNQAGSTPLPSAVEVVLELDDWGSIRRLFRIAG